MNQVFGAPMRIFKLTVSFCARPRMFVSCHFSALWHRDPISLYTLVINVILNIQQDQPLGCKWLNFDPSNVVVLFKNEEKGSHVEFVKGLHWISLCAKSLSKFKFSAKEVCRDFAVTGLKML
jgi:hypothetical protein